MPQWGDQPTNKKVKASIGKHKVIFSTEHRVSIQPSLLPVSPGQSASRPSHTCITEKHDSQFFLKRPVTNFTLLITEVIYIFSFLLS